MSFLTALAAIAQILLIDLSLAGDNAVAVGLAASGLPEKDRHRAVIAGIAAATVLRIVFAVFAVQLLHITGLLMAGGLLLLWVAWKMERDIGYLRRRGHGADRRQLESVTDPPPNLPLKGGGVSAVQASGNLLPRDRWNSPPLEGGAGGGVTPAPQPQAHASKKLSAAITQIVIADVSMSLDNVLAVAGVARENLWVLAGGLGLSVLLMGMASALVARLTNRFPAIAYAGLAVVLYTALRMVWEGSKQMVN